MTRRVTINGFPLVGSSLRTRVKICGITGPADAREAGRLGADSIGLVFHEGSPRSIDVESARAVRAALPPFVTVTALFLNAPAARVREVLDAVAVDLLQFHGGEAPGYCVQFGRPYIKAVPMGAGADPERVLASHVDAAGFLLDSHSVGEPGGSGVVFDWAAIPDLQGRPLILAGGLTPDNVADAVRQVRPWAVDVSSGVESAPGVKDVRRMASFISEVQRGEHL